MSQLTHTVRRSPCRVRFGAVALLLILAVFAVFWIGRASAGNESSVSDLYPPVSNVPTPRADGVTEESDACTTSQIPEFNDMPDTSKTFNLGGRATRPVIVLFQAEWHQYV